jgi:uncharacterized protein YceK
MEGLALHRFFRESNMKRLLPLTALLLGACSTVSTHVAQPDQTYPYIGLREASAEVARAWREPVIPGEVIPRVMLDWPLSLVGDTVLLPWDAVVAWSNTSDD